MPIELEAERDPTRDIRAGSAYAPLGFWPGRSRMGNGSWQLEGNAAELYQRYLVPQITTKWAEDLVSRARPRPGETVLDIACGTGVVARLVGKILAMDRSRDST